MEVKSIALVYPDGERRGVPALIAVTAASAANCDLAIVGSWSNVAAISENALNPQVRDHRGNVDVLTASGEGSVVAHDSAVMQYRTNILLLDITWLY